MECVPIASGVIFVAFGMFKVAEPPATTVEVPRVVAPSLNVTEPVAVPAPVAAPRVAVKVTVCPTTEGDGVETTVVVVPVLLTTCEYAAEVLPAKLPSPLYTAVMECVPPASGVVFVAFGMLSVADPPATTVEVPIVVAPSLNVTVPVAVPAPVEAFSVAVNVTVCPTTEGDGVETTAVVVGVLLTTCEYTGEVLLAKFPSPL
jgi:hypothetical protein